MFTDKMNENSYTCTYTHTYKCKQRYMHTHIYTCTSTYMPPHTYMHKYMFMNVHTHSNSSAKLDLTGNCY